MSSPLLSNTGISLWASAHWAHRHPFPLVVHRFQVGEWEQQFYWSFREWQRGVCCSRHSRYLYNGSLNPFLKNLPPTAHCQNLSPVSVHPWPPAQCHFSLNSFFLSSLPKLPIFCIIMKRNFSSLYAITLRLCAEDCLFTTKWFTKNFVE